MTIKGLVLAAIVAAVIGGLPTNAGTSEWTCEDQGKVTAEDYSCVPLTFYSVDVSNAPESVSTALIARGWYGDPTDGREALYAPSVDELECVENGRVVSSDGCLNY